MEFEDQHEIKRRLAQCLLSETQHVVSVREERMPYRLNPPEVPISHYETFVAGEYLVLTITLKDVNFGKRKEAEIVRLNEEAKRGRN